jgi:integrase
MEYALDEVLAMLRILEPLDLRAAVALALAYFGSVRPAEIRGLQLGGLDRRGIERAPNRMARQSRRDKDRRI